VLFGLRAKSQLVDMVDDFAQIVAALYLVLKLGKDLPDLVIDRVRPRGPLRKSLQVREQLLVDEVSQIVAGQGFVVV